MRKKAIFIGGIIFLVLSILIATLLLRQQQDIRQRASDTTPTATPSATTTPLGISIDQEEWNFIQILNNHRQTLGLPLLKASLKLTKAAEWMSHDMATTGNLSHTDSLGRSIDTRIPSFGYTATSLGENIAHVGGSGQNVFDKWFASTQGHKEQMETTQEIAIGIAREIDQGGTSWFWTADFGSILDQEVTPDIQRTTTPTITDTPTNTPTTDPTTTTTQPTPTNTNTPIPTNTSTPTPTRTPTPSPTNTPTSTPTRTPTPTLQPTATNTPTPTRTPTPIATVTSTPTASPTPSPTFTIAPTNTPTLTPTSTSAPIQVSPTPTIASPGGVTQIAGIVSIIFIVIAGGIFLLML